MKFKFNIFKLKRKNGLEHLKQLYDPINIVIQ